MKRIRSKRGVTIVEAVVAMTVLTIVTVSAIAVIRQARFSSSQNVTDTQARIIAENALECFKCFSADEQRAFDSIIVSNGVVKEGKIYTFESAYCSLTMWVDYGANHFHAFCVNPNGRVMFDIDFRKGY